MRRRPPRLFSGEAPHTAQSPSLPLADVLLQLLVLLLVEADLLGGAEVLVGHPAQNIRVRKPGWKRLTSC